MEDVFHSWGLLLLSTGRVWLRLGGPGLPLAAGHCICSPLYSQGKGISNTFKQHLFPHATLVFRQENRV